MIRVKGEPIAKAVTAPVTDMPKRNGKSNAERQSAFRARHKPGLSVYDVGVGECLEAT